MAASCANLDAGAVVSAGQTSQATASVSPGSNRLVLVTVLTYNTAPANTLPTSVSGAGLTFTMVDSINFGSPYTVSLWRAMSSSPSTGAITIDYGATSVQGIGWVADHLDGVDTGGTNGSAAVVQSATAMQQPGTTTTATLSAFGSTDNATYGGWGYVLGSQPGVTVTEGTGFTRVGYINSLLGGGTFIGNSEFRSDNDTSVDITYSQSAYFGGVAIEVKAAAASAPVFTAQPESQSSASGGTVTFNCTVTGATSYQWESAAITSLYSNAPGSWSSVGGATSEDYTTGTLADADNGKWYRLKATNASGDTYSQPVRVWIKDMASAGKGGALKSAYGHRWLWTTADGSKLLRKPITPENKGSSSPIGDALATWWWPASTGPATHSTSGTLTGQGATVSGTAAHLTLHTSSGSLVGQGSSIAGTSVHYTLHATSGALTGQGSSVSGSALRYITHDTSGALLGPGAVLSGSATHSVSSASHDTSGALAGQGSSVSGTALRYRQFDTTGALTGPGSSISGAAAHYTLHASSGALTGQIGSVAGTALRFRAFSTSGDLVGQGSAISGTAVHSAPGVHDASGDMIGSGASVSGVATLVAIPSAGGGGSSRKRIEIVVVEIDGIEYRVPVDHLSDFLAAHTKEEKKPPEKKKRRKGKPVIKAPEYVAPVVVVKDAPVDLLPKIDAEIERTNEKIRAIWMTAMVRYQQEIDDEEALVWLLAA